MTEIATDRAAQLREVLACACARAGLAADADAAELLKYTNNAVYRLAEQPVVVRIGVGETGIARAPRVVTMARWLATHDAPTVRLLESIDQPVYVDNRHAVTFWQELPRRPPTDRWSGAALAAPLRVLHDLTVDDADLPRWDPFAAAAQRLAVADPALPADDLRWLREQWAQTAGDYRRLPPVCLGIVHGDAHTGNLLRPTHGGTPVLADLDSSGVGPIAWDLAVPAVDSVRFGEPDFYTAFVEAYGRDVTELVEWPVLRRIRELLLVTSAIPDLARRPAIAREHAYRLRTLRDGDIAAAWHPYR